MRAAPRPAASGLVPLIQDWVQADRSNHRAALWVSEEQGSYDAVCLACPDLPCAALGDLDVAADVGIDMSHSPHPGVCPVDAVHAGDQGHAVIDQDSCVQCGACVSRCPVGALSVQEPGRAPVVSMQSDVPTRPASADFFEARAAIADALHYSTEPVDARLLRSQCEGVLAGLAEARDPGLHLRLLVRDGLNANGVPVRLKNIGDNNAPCEALARLGSSVLAIEIQPHGDEISGVRRLLAATARLISRHGVAIGDIVPVLVLASLPNSRAGLYELMEDVEARLGFRVRVITVPILVALINKPTVDLEALLEHGLRVARTSDTLLRDLEVVTGLPPSAVADLGMHPAK